MVVRALQLAARLLLGLRVEGREHLPAEGTFIISPNHQSYLDAFLLVGALPYRTFRRLFFVGASEYFETPLTRKLAQLMNVVPVDPDANLLRAMQAGAFGLRRGMVLSLFPEGERSPDGTPRRFKKGAAITAIQTQVPIVPVALHGLFEIWPRGARLRWRALAALGPHAVHDPLRPPAPARGEPGGRERPVRAPYRAAAGPRSWRCGTRSSGSAHGGSRREIDRAGRRHASRPEQAAATASRATTSPRAAPAGRSARSWSSAGRWAGAGSAARRSRPGGSRTSSPAPPPPSRRRCRTCRP